MMVRVYVARDKGEDNDEYWLALEPADHDFDSEDDSVQFYPYQATSCASMGGGLWKALGLPDVAPGEQRSVEIEVTFKEVNT